MLTSAVVRTLNFCIRHAWPVILVALVLTIGSTAYTALHFSVDTNIDHLMSPDLDWRKREIAYRSAFPKSAQLILVVVDGPTPEMASAASRTLAQELAKKKDVFRSVESQDTDTFFRRNGLLFASVDQLEGMTSRLTSAAPLIGTRPPARRQLWSWGVREVCVNPLRHEPRRPTGRIRFPWFLRTAMARVA